jgi:hypothetical protein
MIPQRIDPGEFKIVHGARERVLQRSVCGLRLRPVSAAAVWLQIGSVPLTIADHGAPVAVPAIQE